MKTGKPSLAFVVQGTCDEFADAGGALCLQTAQYLAPHADIEVLTTCARDAGSGRNQYPAGHAIVDGVHVNRFPASTALRDYVRIHERRFDRVAFFGYRNAATYFTLPLVGEKAVLWPLAHDERPLDLAPWGDFFAAPRRLVFCSEDERRLFALHFPSQTKGDVVAIQTPTGLSGDAVRFRDRYGINGPFLLYFGSPEQENGGLIEYFTKHESMGATHRRLVVAGKGTAEMRAAPGVVILGGLDERARLDAIAAADLVVIPSAANGRATAVLEAWANGKPVLVNAAALGLVERCRRANAGLWYSNYDEFTAAIDLLTPHVASRLGEQGRYFVEGQGGWEDAVSAYRRILGC